MLGGVINKNTKLYAFYLANTRVTTTTPRGCPEDNFRYELFQILQYAESIPGNFFNTQLPKFKQQFPGKRNSTWQAMTKSVERLWEAWRALGEAERVELSASDYNGSSVGLPVFGGLGNATPIATPTASVANRVPRRPVPDTPLVGKRTTRSQAPSPVPGAVPLHKKQANKRLMKEANKKVAGRFDSASEEEKSCGEWSYMTATPMAPLEEEEEGTYMHPAHRPKFNPLPSPSAPVSKCGEKPSLFASFLGELKKTSVAPMRLVDSVFPADQPLLPSEVSEFRTIALGAAIEASAMAAGAPLPTNAQVRALAKPPRPSKAPVPKVIRGDDSDSIKSQLSNLGDRTMGHDQRILVLTRDNRALRERVEELEHRLNDFEQRMGKMETFFWPGVTTLDEARFDNSVPAGGPQHYVRNAQGEYKVPARYGTNERRAQERAKFVEELRSFLSPRAKALLPKDQ